MTNLFTIPVLSFFLAMPLPGAWYQVQKGDVLRTVASRAPNHSEPQAAAAAAIDAPEVGDDVILVLSGVDLDAEVVEVHPRMTATGLVFYWLDVEVMAATGPVLFENVAPQGFDANRYWRWP